MKIKNVNLEWNVLASINRDEVYPYNVLWDSLPNTIAKQVRSKKITCRADLEKYLKGEFMSIYWSRAQYEILVCPLFDKDGEHTIKLDVWYQINMNFKHIVDYIIRQMQLNI